AALSVHDIRGDRGGKVVHEGECGPGHATQEGVGRLTEEGEIDPAAAFTTDGSGTERDDSGYLGGHHVTRDGPYPGIRVSDLGRYDRGGHYPERDAAVLRRGAQPLDVERSDKGVEGGGQCAEGRG